MICTTLKINFNPPGNPVISRSIELNRKHPNSYERKKESNEINENNDRSKTQLTKSESLPNESPKLIFQNLPPPKRRMTRRRQPWRERKGGWTWRIVGGGSGAIEEEGVGGAAIRNYCGTIDKRRLRGRTTEPLPALRLFFPFFPPSFPASSSARPAHSSIRNAPGPLRITSHLRNTSVIAVLRGMSDSFRSCIFQPARCFVVWTERRSYRDDRSILSFARCII